MAETFKFALVSPEKVLISADAKEVLVPGSEGDFTVLPRHAPVIATLRPGILRIPGNDAKHGEIYVRGGLAEVNSESLTVLAEQAIPVSELNAEIMANEIKVLEDDLSVAVSEDARIKGAEMLQQLRTLSENLHIAA
jgi:F-type H+-transporting ATPase subunit epsilon